MRCVNRYQEGLLARVRLQGGHMGVSKLWYLRGWVVDWGEGVHYSTCGVLIRGEGEGW